MTKGLLQIHGNAFYNIITIAIALVIPILIYSPLKKIFKRPLILLAIDISVGVILLLMGFTLPLFIFSPQFPEYPKVTKRINYKYYFTQQEYGFVNSMPGKNLYFFEYKKFWFDKEIGHIQWLIDTRDMDVKIENTNIKKNKRIIITENAKLVLDTVLPFNKNFNFKYLSWR